jgi:hypothetical protein
MKHTLISGMTGTEKTKGYYAQKAWSGILSGYKP